MVIARAWSAHVLNHPSGPRASCTDEVKVAVKAEEEAGADAAKGLGCAYNDADPLAGGHRLLQQRQRARHGHASVCVPEAKVGFEELSASVQPA